MNVLLCCAAGMSTSLLVSRMKKKAQELGMEGKIWAVPGDAVINHLDKADVILLGPQVRYLLPEFKSLVETKGIIVEVIDTVHYGTINGEAVLEFANKLVSK